MEEQDYIELNTLLAKLRVHCLKQIGNPHIEAQESYRMVQRIDYIRKKAPIVFNCAEF